MSFANKLLLDSRQVYCWKLRCFSMTATRFFYPESLTITQLFYVTTSSSLKPIVHDLLYSKMLRECNSSPSWKVNQKIFCASHGDPTSPSSAPPYLPTSSYTTVNNAQANATYPPFSTFCPILHQTWTQGIWPRKTCKGSVRKQWNHDCPHTVQYPIVPTCKQSEIQV